MTGKHFTPSFVRLGVLLCAVALVSACDAMNMDTADNALPVITSPTYLGLSSIQPPPPKAEEAPVLLDPQTQVWKPGYWDQSGLGFNWVSGELVARPSPTATWAPTYWARRQYGWAFVPGYWE